MKTLYSIQPNKTEIIQLFPDETMLIQQLRSGCPKTFKKLYKMYSTALLGVIGRIVKSDEVAEDLLQEVFVKIWKSIDRYETSKGRLFTWMMSMTRNLAIDYTRSKANLQKAKRSPIEELSAGQFTHYQTSMNPDVIGIKTLTGHLKGSEKDVLDLIYFQGYTHMEVAETLNLPLGTVKTRLRRAILTLRTLLNPSEIKEVKTA